MLHKLVGGIASENLARARDWAQRGAIRLALLAVFGVIALGGASFMAVAAYLGLRTVFLPWESALIVGAGLLFLALLGALITARATREPARKPAAPHPSSPAAAPDKTRAQDAPTAEERVTRLGEHLGAALQQREVRTTDVMIAALVAGTVLGASPALRERVLGRHSHSAARRRKHSGRGKFT